jgi:diguanylate cyclase (GGDEF)-like protein/PAS domain S-box-containing protein
MLKRFWSVNLIGAGVYLLAAILGYWACLGNATLLTVKPAFGVAVVVGWFWPLALPGIGLAALLSYLVGLHASIVDAAVFGLTQAAGAALIRPLFSRLARRFDCGRSTDDPAFWVCLAAAVIAGSAVAAVGNTWFVPQMREPVVNCLIFFALAGSIAAVSTLGAAHHCTRQKFRNPTRREASNYSTTLGVILIFALSAGWLGSQGTLALVAVLVLGAGILVLDGASFSVLAFMVPLLSSHALAGAGFATGKLLGGYRADVPLFLLAMLGFVLISLRERGAMLTRKLDQQTHHATAVVSALPDLVTIQNRKGDYVVTVSTSHNFPRLPQDLTGRNVREFMPEEYASRRIALLERVIDTQTPQTEKISAVLSGKVRWVEVRGVPYEAGLCLVIAREITAEYEALERLRVSEAHNRAVIEALSDMVIVLSDQGVPVLDLSGQHVPRDWPQENWLNRPLEDFLPARAAGEVRAAVEGVIASQQSRTLELHGSIAKDGVWWQLRMAPYGDRQVLTTVRNITSERNAHEQARHHVHMMSLIENHIRELVILQDKFGTFSYVSPASRKLFGLEPDWLTEARFLERVSHKDLQSLLAIRAEIIAGARGSARLEFQFLHHNGEKVWVSQELVPVKDQHGTVTHVLSTVRDVTERKEYLDQLSLAKTAVDGIRDGMMVTDIEGVILWVNRKFTELTGYSADDALGRNESDILVSEFTPVHRLEEQKAALERDGAWTGELMTQRQNGETFSEYRIMSTVMTEDGNEVILSLMSDLSEERAREELLWQASTHDSLTGLPNIRSFNSGLEYARNHAVKIRRKYAVLTIGLNCLSQVSESYGRQHADELLKDVAQRLSNSVRDMDMVARLGDSIFGILSEEMRGTAEISTQAMRLLEVFETPFKVAGEDVYERPSVGISIFPEHGEDADELISHSRSAMEEARATSSTATYRFYSKHLHLHERERIRLETHLRRALLEGDELSLAYQPQIAFASGKIVGFEALCRWQNPQLGDVNPAAFIPVAEASGLINALGTWSIEAACERLKMWQNAGLQNVSVSVNLSPKQLRASTLVAQVVSALEQANLDPHRLHLEITEASLKEGLQQATGVLRQLKETGVQLILDDFGTGYSNLSQLQDLPLDGIKIAGSFVNKLASDSAAAAICDAVIRMAHTMGIRAIAKSVETEEQHQILKGLGCDAFQGYLFSPAVSELEARALLKG